MSSDLPRLQPCRIPALKIGDDFVGDIGCKGPVSLSSVFFLFFFFGFGLHLLMNPSLRPERGVQAARELREGAGERERARVALIALRRAEGLAPKPLAASGPT